MVDTDPSTPPTDSSALLSEVSSLQEKNLELQGQLAQYREAQMEWEQTQHIFKLITENIDDLVAIINRQGKRVWNNPAYFRVLGYDPNEMAGKYSMLEIHSDDQAKVTEAFSEAMESGIGRRIEYRMQHCNGEWLSFESQARAVKDTEGQVELIVVVARDITGRKEIEEERQRDQNVEAMGVVAEGVAHEYNDIISAMVGYVSSAKMLAASDRVLVSKLMEVERIAQRATEVTKRLSFIIQKEEIERRSINLKPMLHEIGPQLTQSSRARCEFMFPEALSSVMGDEDALRRVFTNIITNAVQSMTSSGVIRITAQNININSSTTGRTASLEPRDYVRFDVRDQGCGMSELTAARIFEPYFTTHEGAGGLGLTIALSLVKRHHGTIIAQSAQNVGTTVSIYLPAAAEAARRTASVINPNQTKTQKRVLVMDDEKVISDFIGMTLKHLGYEAVLTNDGAQAIAAYAKARAQKNIFDVVIMDLIVPQGVGGLDALQTLQKMNPEVKVIMSTGHLDHPAIQHYRDYGISGTILKPYSVKKLQEVIESVLSDSATQS